MVIAQNCRVVQKDTGGCREKNSEQIMKGLGGEGTREGSWKMDRGRRESEDWSSVRPRKAKFENRHGQR